MLIINTHNNKPAAARVDFVSHGMLHGTCLGMALQLRHQGLGIDADDPLDNEGESNSLGSIGEHGHDLDFDDDNDNNNIPPSLVDGSPIFSEVTLTLGRGIVLHIHQRWRTSLMP